MHNCHVDGRSYMSRGSVVNGKKKNSYTFTSSRTLAKKIETQLQNEIKPNET